MEKENKIRCNITISPTIKAIVDAEAYRMGMSSSAFITLCINHYFMQTESLAKMESLKDMLTIAQQMGLTK